MEVREVPGILGTGRYLRYREVQGRIHNMAGYRAWYGLRAVF